MPQVTIVYWRDIPAQVIVGRGRRAAKQPLSERFEQAIDRCAMKLGLRESTAYLDEWRRADPFEADGDEDEIARLEAARIERQYDAARLRELIENSGRV